MRISRFWIFFAVALCFAFIVYNIWTIPISLTKSDPYYASELVGTRIYIPIALYLISIIVTSYLSIVSFRALRIISPKEKFSVLALNRFFILMLIAAIILEIGVIILLLVDLSTFYISINGFHIYIYPSSLALGYFVGGFMALWLFIFADNEYHGGFNIKRASPYLILLAVYLILTFDYRNWYGVVNWTAYGETSIREITSLLLLLLLLIGVLWALIPLTKRLRKETNIMKKIRLKIIFLGFLIFLGFFVFLIIDALAKLPYTPWMIPAYACSITGIILIWLGFIPPTWLIKWISRKYESGK